MSERVGMRAGAEIGCAMRSWSSTSLSLGLAHFTACKSSFEVGLSGERILNMAGCEVRDYPVFGDWFILYTEFGKGKLKLDNNNNPIP